MIQQKKHISVVTQLFGQLYIKNGIKKKRSLLFLLAFALILIPSINALTITDTTFFASVTNYTIHVDTITLDQVNVTNSSIEFANLTSTGSNFVNTNATFNAIANFVGLEVGLTIRNLNTSTDLFTSATGNQDFNATFTPGQNLRIMSTTTRVCSTGTRNLLRLTIIFFALAVLLIPIFILFMKGKIALDINTNKIILVFASLILGIIFLQVIANGVINVCG